MNINKLNAKPIKFQLIAGRSGWLCAFAVEASMASAVAKALNDQDDDDCWEVISIPLDADQIKPTLNEWEAQGIL